MAGDLERLDGDLAVGRVAVQTRTSPATALMKFFSTHPPLESVARVKELMV